MDDLTWTEWLCARMRTMGLTTSALGAQIRRTRITVTDWRQPDGSRPPATIHADLAILLGCSLPELQQRLARERERREGVHAAIVPAVSA